MMWPLGKKFDLWVDAAPSDILGPLRAHQEGDISRWDYIDPTPAHIIDNIIIVPGVINTALSRQVWASVRQSGSGARVRGQYGYMLIILNMIFAPVLILSVVTAIQMLATNGPDLNQFLGFGQIAAGTLIYDRITRFFAKTRYDDFVGYLTRISRDGAVHLMVNGKRAPQPITPP